MVIFKKGKKLNFPGSEGFTDTLEKIVKILDGNKNNFKKTRR